MRLRCRHSLKLKPGPADSVYWAISKRLVNTRFVAFGGTMRFRGMTLRLVRSVSVFSCLWLGVLTAAAQQRVAQPVGGQIHASSPDANRANAVTMAVPGELPESPGAVQAQELGSTERMPPQSSAAAQPQSPTSQSSPSEPAQPPS